MTVRPCILMTAQRGFSLSRSRRDIIAHFLAEGWRVVIATTDDAHARDLANLGATLEPLPYVRGGLRPVSDMQVFRRLVSIARRYRPVLVHAFQSKPLIMATLAARMALGSRVTIVGTITGLGHAFIKGGLVRRLASLGFAVAAPRLDALIFQNDDDRQLFREAGWLAPAKMFTIVGSGVETDVCTPCAAGERSTDTVVMMGRLLWQKGIREFVEASAQIDRRETPVRFLLAGEFDGVHPDAVPPDYIERAVAEGHIEYLGYLESPEELLRTCTLCVLPSYREGCPRVVLEASACGVPSVGADAPGTRQAIRHGETGLLVPVGDAAALAEAIRSLMTSPETVAEMGRKARQLAEREFAAPVIVRRHLQLYRQLGVGIADTEEAREATP